MSMQCLNLAFLAPITGGKKAVLLALADRANPSGYCYPALDDIAIRAGVSRRSVIYALKGLEDDGYIVVIREQGCVNKYVILSEKLSPTRAEDAPHEVIHTGAESVETRAESVKTRATIAPKPINPLTQKRAREVRGKITPENPDRQPHRKNTNGLEGLRSIKSIFAGMPTTSPPKA